MSINDLYEAVRDNTRTRLNQAFTAFYRGLFHIEFKRQQLEDDALAALRAAGDSDGTHLRQAVALAFLRVDDESMEAFLARYARGEKR